MADEGFSQIVPVQKAWEAHYNGTAITSESNGVAKMIVDKDGNCYVTGSTRADRISDNFLTVKYSASGQRLWVAEFNSKDNAIDSAKDLAVDNEGNVYVTGTSSDPSHPSSTVKYDSNGRQLWVAKSSFQEVAGTNFPVAMGLDTIGNVYVAGTSNQDYVVIKYNADGNKNWISHYKNINGGTNLARGLVIDSSGNAFVTGSTNPAAGSPHFLTVKFGPDGTVNRAFVYNNGFSDQPNAIKVDAVGNVYVTGQSANHTDYDYATVKYDNDGNQLWASRYDGPRSDIDQAFALALDGVGNIYVTGQSYGTNTGGDYATIKYLPDGTQAWVARYSSPGNHSDAARTLKVDSLGNVVVSGNVNSNGYWNHATIKYDSSGNQLWAQVYTNTLDTNSWPVTSGLDNDGNVYLAFTVFDAISMADYVTIKYDPNGNSLWENHFDHLNFNNIDNAKTIKLDANSNAYVTGSSLVSESKNDFVTIKYNPAGVPIWINRYSSNDQSNDVAALVLDNLGSAYVTGVSGSNCITIKYDSSGNQLWSTSFNAGTGTNIYPNSIGIDSTGNVYVSGNSTFMTNMGSLVVKFDANGNKLWDSRDATGTNAAMAVDGSGNVYLAGGTKLGLFLISRYGPDGANTWKVVPSSTSDGMSLFGCATTLALDDLGNVLVAGKGSGFPITSDLSITAFKYKTNGAKVWDSKYPTPSNFFPSVSAAATDTLGNFYICGFMVQGSPPASDFITIKYGTNGTRAWTNRYNYSPVPPGGSGSYDQANALAVDTGGNVYVAGSINRDSAYGILKYAANGAQLWAQTYIATGNNQGHTARSIAVDNAGGVYVTGQANGDYSTLKYIQNFPPLLSLIASPTDQIISWPAAASNSVLEFTTNLNAPTIWSGVINTSNQTNYTNASLNGTRFYRLRSN